MRRAVTKRPRRRTLAVTMLMLATTAGATAAGIAAASAAEPPHFVATIIPSKDAPLAAGQAFGPLGEVQRLSITGLLDLCRANNFNGIEDVTPNGEQWNPDGTWVYSVYTTCKDFKG